MIRVHCECCGEHFGQAEAEMAVLVIPPDKTTPSGSMWQQLLGSSRAECHHHYCGPCARAIRDFVAQVKREGLLSQIAPVAQQRGSR